MNLGKNEIGFAICRTPGGELVNGPVNTGTPMSVDIPVSCPPGTRLEGLHHTHPGGIAFPSKTDIRLAVRLGIKNMCISDDSRTDCFRIIP